MWRRIRIVGVGLVLVLSSISAAFAHGEGKHIMGTASAVAADRLNVKTKEGKDVSIIITSKTQFRRTGAGQSAKPQVGDRVVAEVTEDAAGLTATEVRFATPTRNP